MVTVVTTASATTTNPQGYQAGSRCSLIGSAGGHLSYHPDQDACQREQVVLIITPKATRTLGLLMQVMGRYSLKSNALRKE